MSNTPAAAKRRKACEACRVLKARCDPSVEDPDETCERCWRAGKECVPAQSRRQRDRIADLENQVAELTKALREQNISLPESQSPDPTVKRKRQKSTHDDECDAVTNFVSPTTARTVDPATDAALAFLDECVPRSVQQEALDVYVKQMVPVYPVVPIDRSDLAGLRETNPLVLLSVITFAAAGDLTEDVQFGLVERIMHVFAHNLIATGNRSLELVQALLIAGFWFRVRPGLRHATMCQLLHLATNDAIDLGIAGPQALRSPGAGPIKKFDICSLSARRTWLACFVAQASLSSVTRRPDAVTWTPYHDESLLHLTTSSEALPTDGLFGQIVSAEKLLYQIATCVGLCDPSSIWDPNTPASKFMVSTLRQEIARWRIGLTGDPALNFYLHIAVAYLNEPILHTATNKLSFAVPPSPNKIQPEDFAAMPVTVERFAALYALRDALHGALDVALELDTNTLLGVTSLSYIPRILYSLFVLIKLYIAVSAPGNTYGAVLDRGELRIEEYFARMKPVAIALRNANQSSFNSKILGAYVLFENWFNDYKAIIDDYQKNTTANAGPEIYYQSDSLFGQEELADFYKEPIFNDDLSLAGLQDQDLMSSIFSDQLPFPMPDLQSVWQGGLE
ncbi:hypothetical protein M409DRAFT_55006 [Zasmidium cellare ATCC 36951]|uniref:Zn(2)-C6 fungal-type domain-containing protein n=1 Tax=Zasmidium cellare ATCC 36951 TaxID=1080233 RepID=A0A6A6CLT6_ZASCE|nr:uncharacterized protein M409DRAFT_55006 [Zasmidium cellare ATCC 36951]KAF2166689.1 hypothetical protein M409DRAFT_55006 [Zasmidium cellare ATCC 36951]